MNAGDVDLLIDRQAWLGINEKVGGEAEESDGYQQQRKLPELGQLRERSGRVP